MDLTFSNKQKKIPLFLLFLNEKDNEIDLYFFILLLRNILETILAEEYYLCSIKLNGQNYWYIKTNESLPINSQKMFLTYLVLHFFLQSRQAASDYSKLYQFDPPSGTQLPAATVGEFYSNQFKVKNVPKDQYYISVINDLPSGLQLVSGTLQGTPNLSCNYKITLEATSQHFEPFSAVYWLIVKPQSTNKVQKSPETFVSMYYDAYNILKNASNYFLANITACPSIIKFNSSSNRSQANVQLLGGTKPYSSVIYFDSDCLSTSEPHPSGNVTIKLDNRNCSNKVNLTFFQVIDANKYRTLVPIMEVIFSKPEVSYLIDLLRQLDPQEVQSRLRKITITNTITNIGTQSLSQLTIFDDPIFLMVANPVYDPYNYRYSPSQKAVDCPDIRDPILSFLRYSECEVATVVDIYQYFLRTKDGDILKWSICTNDLIGRKVQIGQKIYWKGKLIPNLTNSYFIEVIDLVDQSAPDSYSKPRPGTVDQPWPPLNMRSPIYYKFTYYGLDPS